MLGRRGETDRPTSRGASGRLAQLLENRGAAGESGQGQCQTAFLPTCSARARPVSSAKRLLTSRHLNSIEDPNPDGRLGEQLLQPWERAGLTNAVSELIW